jgi:hypothetical protein
MVVWKLCKHWSDLISSKRIAKSVRTKNLFLKGGGTRARWFHFIFQDNFGFGYFVNTLPKLEEWNSFWQLSVSFRSPTNPPWEVTFYAWEYKGFSKFIKGKKSKQRFWFHYFTTFFWAKIKSSGDITGSQTLL